MKPQTALDKLAEYQAAERVGDLFFVKTKLTDEGVEIDRYDVDGLAADMRAAAGTAPITTVDEVTWWTLMADHYRAPWPTMVSSKTPGVLEDVEVVR